ncbi:SPASM domain-containing protein [Candidatus Margulisiibacteriota bacterium]
MKNHLLSNLYDLLIKGHAAFPYLLRTGYALPPIKIQLEVTHQCNLSCAYCYQDRATSKADEELNIAEINSLFSSLPRHTFLSITGGEPLCRKDIKDILIHAQKRFNTGLLTNGLLLDKDMINNLIDHKLLLLGISMDYLAEHYDKQRNIPGSYVHLLDNIANLQNTKKKLHKKWPLLDIKTSIFPDNVSQLINIYHKAIELDADYLTLSMLKLSPWQFNPNLQDDLPWENKCKIPTWISENKILLKDVFRELNKMSRKHRTKLRFYPRNLNLDKYIDPNININNKYFSCSEPWSGLQISANGDVYPCLSLKIGNIRENTLKNIWNSERYRKFRKKLLYYKVPNICEGCCYLYSRA